MYIYVDAWTGDTELSLWPLLDLHYMQPMPHDAFPNGGCGYELLLWREGVLLQNVATPFLAETIALEAGLCKVMQMLGLSA